MTIRKCALDRPTILEVVDPHVGEEACTALHELGFVRSEKGWGKVCLRGCFTLSELETLMESFRQSDGTHTNRIRQAIIQLRRAGESATSGMVLATLERRLSPAKILDERIPNFIVPIQPRWASELFDEDLASRNLFHADNELALRIENVYYRSGHIPVVSAPGHILWYVSKGGERCPGPQSLRACSNIYEVVKDIPKNLYRRFRRLGVYEWSDLVNVARDNTENEILAFTFGATDPLPKEVPLEAAKEIFCQHGQPMPPLSMPVKIPVACFRDFLHYGGVP